MKGAAVRCFCVVLKYRALITAAETREMHHSRPAKIDSPPPSTLRGEKAFFFKALACVVVFFSERCVVGAPFCGRI